MYATNEKFRITSQISERGPPGWTFRIWQDPGCRQGWYKATVPVPEVARVCHRVGRQEEEEGQEVAGRGVQIIHFCPSHSRIRAEETHAKEGGGNEAGGEGKVSH